MMTKKFRLGVLLALLCIAAPAWAAPPATTTIEGVLTSAGGGAAADGTYAVTFSIYASKTATSAAWSEAGVKVVLKNGRFQHRLGSIKALNPKTLAALKTPWFGVKVATDPELARMPLSSALYALVAGQVSCTGCIGGAQLASGAISPAKIGFNYAGSTTKGGPAKDLSCSGCVSVSELKFDGNVNLGANSLKAKNGAFTGDVAAASVTANSFAGDGSKLTGIKVPKGECTKAGHVVKGINADGSLKCVVAMDPKALPADGIDEISNGLLHNQFDDTISADKKTVFIPDNTGSEAVSNLTFPDIGAAQTFQISVHVENTDLSKIGIVVLPPNDKKKGYTMCDPCGAKDAKILKKSWSPTAKPKAGDLGYWIGKNPKGLWNLKVLDSSYCVVQAPGNSKYCNPTAKRDGWIADWSIKIRTLSTKKIGVKGNLVLAANTAPCNSFAIGAIKFSSALRRIQVCDGQQWWPELLGLASSNAGRSCKDIKQRAPSAKSGSYWIDPDGAGKGAPFKVYCDQETGGGGWTLIVKVRGNDKTMNRLNTAQWRYKKLIGQCETTSNQNALCAGYDKVGFTDVMIRSLAESWRNLAWGHRDKYTSMWHIINAGKPVYTRNRLFGAVHNLSYNGNPIYHRDCGPMNYGFFTADWNQKYNKVAGHSVYTGHAGGVVGASLNDWSIWKNGSSYPHTALSTQYCLSDFAVGGGYGNASGTNDDSYAINAHWWGAGNSHTYNWNAHGVFVR